MIRSVAARERFLLAAAAVVASALTACARPEPIEPPQRFVVVGIDGGDWQVVRDLWSDLLAGNLSSHEKATGTKSSTLSSPYRSQLFT